MSFIEIVKSVIAANTKRILVHYDIKFTTDISESAGIFKVNAGKCAASYRGNRIY